jgi:hypothetical protein
MVHSVCSRAAVLGLIAGSVVSCAALAQDSVSNAGGLPGDALNAYTTGASGNQVKNYVVDLATKTSSWGNGYLLGPISKSSLSTQSLYFNHLIASQAASAKFNSGPMARSSYNAWTVAGQGVGPANAAATDNGSGRFGAQLPVTPAQNFATAFFEFAGGPNGVFGDSDDENNVIVNLVGFWPKSPSRLYVSRIVAGINKSTTQLTGLTSNSSLGIGGVDDNGTVVLSGDGFGMLGDDVITNKKLFRVNAASRNVAVGNAIGNSGVTDSANGRIMLSGNTTQTTPTLIPASIAGRSVLIGADLAGNYLFESATNTISTSTTFGFGGSSPRGPLSFSPTVFSRFATGGSDAGTVGVLSRDISATKTRGITLFVINTNGSIDTGARYELPTTNGGITDPVDGFDPANVWGSLGNQEFTNYQSQVTFRGSNGPVAQTVLPNGDLLACALVSASGSGAAVPASMDNYLAVLKVSAADGTASWSIAAHTGNSGGAAGGISKAILSRDISGVYSTIGRIARASEVIPSATTGPSISSPAMDRAGNLYFIADVLLNGVNQPVPTTALLRANRDSSTGGYQLEMIAQLQDIIPGLNSQRNYQVQFISVADGDSVDSGTVFSSSIVQDTLSGVQLGALSYGNPLTLGALVFRAKIVYDYNNDGQFSDPSNPGGSGPDQAYNVQMVLMPKRLRSDIASLGGALGPDGQLTVDDVVVFLSAFFANDTATADMASLGGAPRPDGQLTVDDVLSFLSDFFAGN